MPACVDLIGLPYELGADGTRFNRLHPPRLHLPSRTRNPHPRLPIQLVRHPTKDAFKGSSKLG